MPQNNILTHETLSAVIVFSPENRLNSCYLRSARIRTAPLSPPPLQCLETKAPALDATHPLRGHAFAAMHGRTSGFLIELAGGRSGLG